MSPAIKLDAAGLEEASNRADSLGRDIQVLARQAKSISLAGLPPTAIGWAKAGLTEASSKADAAADSAVRQRHQLRRRAALARRADTARTLRGLGQGVDALENVLAKLDTVRVEGSKGLLIKTSRELGAAKNVGNARRLWQASKWRQKKWATPDDMYRHLKANKAKLTKLHRHAMQLKQYDDQIKQLGNRVPPSVRNLPQHIPSSVRNSPLVRNPVTRRVPVVGAGIGFAADLAGGDSLQTAAGKTAASTAGSALGGAAGAATCAGIAAGTFGIGAATCPVMIAGGTIAGGIAGEYVYKNAKKIADGGRKAVDAAKRVVGTVVPSKKKLSFLPGI